MRWDRGLVVGGGHLVRVGWGDWLGGVIYERKCL